MLILLWFRIFTHRSILSIIRYSNWLACVAVSFPTKTTTAIVEGISLIRAFWEFNEIYVISTEISQVVGRNCENVNAIGKGVGKTIGIGPVNHRNCCFSQRRFSWCLKQEPELISLFPSCNYFMLFSEYLHRPSIFQETLHFCLYSKCQYRLSANEPYMPVLFFITSLLSTFSNFSSY